MDEKNQILQQLLSIVPTKNELDNYKVIIARKFEEYETRIKELEKNDERIKTLENKIEDYENKIQQIKTNKKGS